MCKHFTHEARQSQSLAEFSLNICLISLLLTLPSSTLPWLRLSSPQTLMISPSTLLLHPLTPQTKEWVDCIKWVDSIAKASAVALAMSGEGGERGGWGMRSGTDWCADQLWLRPPRPAQLGPTVDPPAGKGRGSRHRAGGITIIYGVAKSRTRLSDFSFTFHFHALEKEMATHSSILAWRIPGTGEPGGLPSIGSHRVGHD